MKKALIMSLMLILAFSAMTLAGPFIKFDLTLPQTASLAVGFKTDGLTVGITATDIFAPQPPLSLSATYMTRFNWWGTRFVFDIDGIDVYTNYPIPVIDSLGFGATSTMHIATLVQALAADTQSSLASNIFDVYAGFHFNFVSISNTLVPTFNLGFYWEY